MRKVDFKESHIKQNILYIELYVLNIEIVHTIIIEVLHPTTRKTW